MAGRATGSVAGADLAALLARAARIDPGTPTQHINLPEAERSFAFTLDRDLVKLVTLQPGDGSLAVRVRYATEVIVQDDRYDIALSAHPSIVADEMGIVVTWRAPLLAWFAWPTIRRSRRF